MKKFLLLFFVITCSISNDLNSQNKPKKLDKFYLKYANSDNCNINTNVTTGIHTLSTKQWEWAKRRISISYIKTKDEYYLFLIQQLPGGHKFQIQKENPFVIFFEDNKKLIVFPCGDFEGKVRFAIGSFYSISEEQIQQIANNVIKSIHVYITSDAGYRHSEIDNEGKIYLPYKVTDSDTWTAPAKRVLNF